jgi:hypothetical protein
MDAAARKRQDETLINRKTAIRFIVLLGVVSLFGDMTYEGARSVTGPYSGCSARQRPLSVWLQVSVN